MDLQDDGEDHVLSQRARAMLLADERPGDVFTALAKDSSDWDYRGVALVVCEAAGVPRTQAEQRWADTGRQAASLIQPGAEAGLGDTLELVGFFDVHPDFDEREQQTRRLLVQAVNAVAVWPSGYAHGLSRMLQSGRLSDAFVWMATYGARRTRPVPAAYWTHLLAAADLLTDAADDRLEPCMTLCRRQLDQTDVPPSP